MSQRVFITGFGIISAIGNNAEENRHALKNNKHGFGQIETFETAHKNSIPACEIKISDEDLTNKAGLKIQQGFSRTAVLGVLAVKEAIASAGLSKKDIHEAAFLSSTTTGGIREYEKYFKSVQDLSQQGEFEIHADTANPGEHTERIADLFGITRYIATISTACSSSVNTIMQGARLIKSGKVNRAICGGAEALSKFTINGFNSLLILDKEHCRPFDATRKGLNLGEGAAYLVLESEESVKQSGKKILGEVLGYGNANDAFHQTASSPDGTGAYLAMSKALESSKLTAAQVGYINAHGTATENNDLSEGLALQRIFGESVPPFSSTKPFTGHTLAAAGGVEAVFSLMMLQDKFLVPNLNFTTPMSELKIVPLQQTLKQEVNYILSNSFGFGGNTSSIIFGSGQ
jgi:3-oxoacyl-(acyl-carrier-protein) synthase